MESVSHHLNVPTKEEARMEIAQRVLALAVSLRKFYRHCLEANITKLTFYHIRCFLLSKDAFTPNLVEFDQVS